MDDKTLTRCAKRLIRQLCKCQPSPGGGVFIYFESDGSCTFANPETGKELPCKYSAEETREILQYLVEVLLWVRCPQEGVVTVLHAGRHRHEIGAKRAWREFVRSFAFPFLVALATALVFSWLAARFSWFKS